MDATLCKAVIQLSMIFKQQLRPCIKVENTVADLNQGACTWLWLHVGLCEKCMSLCRKRGQAVYLTWRRLQTSQLNGSANTTVQDGQAGECVDAILQISVSCPVDVEVWLELWRWEGDPEDHVGAAQPVGRLRLTRRRQSHHGHQSDRNPRPSPHQTWSVWLSAHISHMIKNKYGETVQLSY